MKKNKEGKITALSMGDKVYKHCMGSGAYEYEVIGVRKNKEGESYELRCLSCKHGWQCEVLACLDDWLNLKYVRMINDPDVDYCDCDDEQEEAREKQFFFHADHEKFFHSTEQEALGQVCSAVASQLNKEIEKDEERLAAKKKRRDEYAGFSGGRDEFRKNFCT